MVAEVIYIAIEIRILCTILRSRTMALSIHFSIISQDKFRYLSCRTQLLDVFVNTFLYVYGALNNIQ